MVVRLAEFGVKEEIKLDFWEDNAEKSLVFNLSTGESNVKDCVEL